MSNDDQTERDYNAAAGPLAGTVVRTGTAGLQTGYTTIDAQGFPMPAYVARPEQHDTDLPVVVVLPEAFGLHEHIADIARRFAHEGYLAVAPDVMARHGDPSSYPDVDSLVTGLLQRIPDEEVLADVDATVEWAVAQHGAHDRVGITGFCWGGRWVWLYAAARASIRAGVAWYGILDGVASGAYPDPELFPAHPIDVAGELRAPVLGLYGGQDDAIPQDTVARMRAGLAARPDSELKVFPEAGHAFFADYRENYHQPSALQAWPDALAWLRDHGV